MVLGACVNRTYRRTTRSCVNVTYCRTLRVRLKLVAWRLELLSIGHIDARQFVARAWRLKLGAWGFPRLALEA